jgi:hypothetical protein
MPGGDLSSAPPDRPATFSLLRWEMPSSSVTRWCPRRGLCQLRGTTAGSSAWRPSSRRRWHS